MSQPEPTAILTMTACPTAPLWTPWGKGFKRRSPSVGRRPPSDERSRLRSYTTSRDVSERGGSCVETAKGEGALLGVCAQVWETRPLRFVKRLVLGWFRADEVEKTAKNARVYHGEQRSDGSINWINVKVPVWPVLEEMTALTSLDDPPISGICRSQLPPDFAADPIQWDAVIGYGNMMHDFVRDVFWETDERGFWVHFGGVVPPAACRRVGLDGDNSPFIQLSRRLPGKGLVSIRSIEPISSNRARLNCHHGYAMVDAPPCVWQGGRRMIGPEHDSWVTYPEEDELERRWAIIEGARSTRIGESNS